MEKSKREHKIIITISFFVFVFFISPAFCAENTTSVEKIEAQVQSQSNKAQGEIDLIEGHYKNGRDYLYRGNFDKAASSFQEALKIAPSYEPAKVYLGIIETDKKARLVNQYYNKSRIYCAKGDFKDAVSNLEQALKLAPYYEPLKKYFNTVVIQYRISLDQGEINSLKVKMADIIAEYDAKIKQVQGLGLGYLLEQALLRCQAGDFENAGHFYELCYKLDPTNEEKISWFVNTTYELKDLCASLDEAYKKIEELSRAQ